MLLQVVGQLLRLQCDEAFERTGHQIGAGNTAEQTICETAPFQRVEDVKQIFLQRIVLVDERKSDQHVTVQNGAGIKVSLLRPFPESVQIEKVAS